MLPRGALRLCASAAVAFTVSACSALRIDVDVYKGPLANEPTVQDKELPILLTGAKPVLLRLRNSLDKSIIGEEETRFIRGYPFDAPQSQARPGADTNVAPRAVNDVLSLYEDDVSSELLPYLNVVSEHVPGYAAAARDLSGLSDTTLWPKWRAAMRILPTDTSKLGCQTAFEEYFDRTYSNSNPRTANQIASMCGDAMKSATNLTTQERMDAAFPSDYSSNATYAQLQDPSFVSLYAKALFGNADSAEAHAFVDAVTRKARAFQAAREHLRKVWLASLDSLTLVSLPESSQARTGIAALIARVTEVRFLAGEFCREMENHETVSELFSILTQDAEGRVNWNTANLKDYSNGQFRPAREELEKALLNDPPKVTALLREADTRFRSARTVPESCKYYDLASLRGTQMPYRDTPKRRFYGLLDGPLVTDKELTDDTELSAQSISPAQLKALTKNVVPDSLDGFESGRLPQGLTTIVRNYLQSLNNGDLDVDSDDARAQRVRLRTAAVQFAEKLLLLTNSDRLFQTTKENQGVRIEETQDLWQTSVPLLQAVANGILVQAQELEAYQTYLDSGQHEAPNDQLLANAAQQDGAVRYLGQLLASLQPAAAVDPKATAGEKRPADPIAQKPSSPPAAAAPGKQPDKKKPKAADAAKPAAPAKSRAAPTPSAAVATNPPAKAEEPAPGAASDATPPKTEAEKAQKADDEASAKYKDLVTQEAGATAALNLVIERGGPPYQEVFRANAKTPAAVADAIRQWIKTGIAAAPKDKVDPRLTQAEAYFESTEFPKAPEADSPRQAYIAMAVHLRQSALAAENAQPAAKQAKTLADAALKNAKQTTAVANAVEPGTKQKPPAPDCSPSATNNADVAKAIEEALPSILEQLRSTNLLSSATSAYFGLVQSMTTGCEAATKDGAVTAAQYRAGLAFLMAHPLTADANVPVPPTWPGSKTSSVDSVITSLRYEQIEALRVDDEGRQKAVADALKAAYDYRASLTYVRPASAYLRSAYPATVFQQDNGVAWKNLLSEEGLRASPFFSESLANKTGSWIPHHAETILRIEAADENDKQSWQNINSVKVSGTAFTNYVVTKDDIGNWYIKSFSSDPSTVIDAATKLAQFNLGVPTSAVNAAKTAAQKTADTADVSDKTKGASDQSATTPAAKTRGTGVQRIIDKYQTTYKSTTAADLDRALKLDAEMKNAIGNAWSANVALSGAPTVLQTFQKNLTNATDALKAQLELLQLPKDAAKAAQVDPGEQIVAALQDVKRCYISLKGTLADDKVSDELTKSAANLAQRATRALIDDFLESREMTVRAFSTAVTVAGVGAD